MVFDKLKNSCKGAKCSKAETGEMRCPFEAGFWKTSRMLDVPAVQYWKVCILALFVSTADNSPICLKNGQQPSMVPRVCQNSIYTYYRDLNANITVVSPMLGKFLSGCCAYQDTTEAGHIRRHC